MKIFTEDPFAQYSAEEEEAFRDKVFYSPNYYNGLKSALKNNASRFLLGQRGDGKSVVIYKLMTDLQKERALPILISRYDEIPLENNKQHFLYIICKAITVNLARILFFNSELRRALDKRLKERLSAYIEMYYDGEYSNEFVEKAKEIKSIKTKNLFKRFINRNLIKAINEFIGIGISISSSSLKNFLGIPDISMFESKDYFKDFELDEIRKIDITQAISIKERHYIQMIEDLSQMLKAIGYSSIVVLFDKIDECPTINSDTEKISNFCSQILTDTDLLLSQNISIVFSLWTEIKLLLTSYGVRFDKFGEIKVTLRNPELVKLLNIRLKHFSSDKYNPVSFETLIPNANIRDEILRISDKSPRTLLRLLGEIYNIQEDREAVSFEDSALADGMSSFCKTFDYGSLRPTTQNDSQLSDWINKLLQLRLPEFTSSIVKDTFKLKGKNADNYLQKLISYGLVKSSGRTNENGDTIYKITDPRIHHLISRGITELS